MDSELKLYLEGMEARICARVDGVKTGLKARIDGISNRIDALEVDLLLRFDHAENQIRVQTEAMETRLLTEFWKWGRTSDGRYRQNSAIMGGA